MALAEQAENHRRLLAGPVEDYKRLAMLDTTLRQSFDAALTAHEIFAKQFRAAESDEIGRLAREAAVSVSAISHLYGTDPLGGSLQKAMQSMHAPWLQRDDVLRS